MPGNNAETNGAVAYAEILNESMFPGRSHLPRTSSWISAVLVATGCSLMVVVSLGAMAAELGNVSIWIWIATAAIGGVQCLLIAELASRFPNRAGGTPQFAYRVHPKGSLSMGALSAWAYWFAWTPGIAVNLILAATFLHNLYLPAVPAVPLAFAIGATLYTITAFGLKLSTVVNAVLTAVAVAVVLLLVVGPVFKPSAFHISQVLPSALPKAAGHGLGHDLGLIAKWAFVATWSSYAAEIASTVGSEIKSSERVMKRVMSVSAVICFIAFAAVPIALFGLVGVAGIQGDPFEVFANAGGVLLGPVGRTLVQLGLTAVLIVAAETFIIGSSRTIYQMAQDGHIPPIFSKINRRGAPVGSIAWDSVVIGIMLIVFGTNVVNVVAAANFGYLIVFVLMPIAYLVLRKHPGGFRLGRPFIIVAVLLMAVNLVMLVVGGAQWGLPVVLVGFGVSLAIIPISYGTRKLWGRRTSAVPDEEPAI